LKALVDRRWFHPLLLLSWTLLGGGLRFTHLTAKPLWTDEFSTLVFSLGNSFRTVPLDQILSLTELLQPLQLNPNNGVGEAVNYLMRESTHPPLYFALSHLWLDWFSPGSELVSLWAGRSLPALLGALSIPAIFGLSWLAFRSRWVAQFAAMAIAVSPYGIFLAQEARHYTLAILWVIASLSCFVAATQSLRDRRPLPLWICCTWVIINGLGIATHYFFGLTLLAEALVLLGLSIAQNRQDPKAWLRSYWWRIYAVAAGTLVGGLLWLPAIQSVPSSDLTDWIQTENRWSWRALINPIFQAIAAWITMLSLLPVEAERLPVVIASGVIMLVFFIWATPKLYRGLKAQWQQPNSRFAIQIMGGFVLGAIAILFGITYGLGTDLTRGARYNFMYFPGVMVLVGAGLAACWQRLPFSSADDPGRSAQESAFQRIWQASGRQVVLVVLVMGVLSGLTVISNLGYRKYYRPDLLMEQIQTTSQAPILIATTHKTHVQTGEMMGIAWEFQFGDRASTQLPQFLLAHSDCTPTQPGCEEGLKTLQQTLTTAARPLDLWLVNFYTPAELELPQTLGSQQCTPDPEADSGVNGYRYQRYHCP
jgi:uncharacterized membrane protein